MTPETKAHAKLSASGSERWLECAGSIALSENAPPEQESSYALEGTEAHECVEFLMKNRKNWKSALSMARERWSEDKIEHAKTMVEYVVFSAKDKNAEILCETKVDLSFVAPDMFGTVDAAIVEEFGTLQVLDFKYGAGVAVEVKDNSQLVYYALGLAHKYHFNFHTVIHTIVQPRAEHPDGPIRHWEISIDELREWEHKFRQGVERAQDPFAKLNPGDWCRWCPAKAICPAISELAFKQAQIDFAPEVTSEIAVPIPNMITPEKLSRTLKAIDKLEVWIEAVKTHAMFVMERGVKIDGFKLVQKRSIRKWINSDKVAKEAYKKFGNQVFETPTLKSPAQFEKTIGEDFDVGPWLKKRTTSESSGLTMVSENDSRAAVNPVMTDFVDEWESDTTTNPRKGVQMKKTKPIKKKTKTTKTRKK